MTIPSDSHIEAPNESTHDSSQLLVEAAPDLSDTEAPSVIWQDVMSDYESLETGTVVEGFSEMSEVDTFIYNSGVSLKRGRGDGGSYLRPVSQVPQKMLAFNSGKGVLQGWSAASTMPSEAMRPKNFLGQFKNMRVVVLDKSLEGAHEAPAYNFVIFADMHSTGIGFRGTAVKKCTVYQTSRKTGDVIFPGPLSARYASVRETLSPEEIAEQIVGLSGESSRKVIINGLRKVLSGGLPGTRR